MKKIISVITLTAILFSMMLAGPVSAAEAPKVDLKKAIEFAKTAFNFDTANHDFNSSYSESMNGRKLWLLSWNNTSSAKGSSISVNVDATTGEIVSMNRWENSTAPAKRIPKYSREEALKKAEELVKKLHPDKFGNMKLMDEYNGNLFRSVYSGDVYSFYFMRRLNGIDFPDNGIQVQVDKNTLLIKNFNMDWDTSLPIPDSKKAIDAAAAKKLYEEKLGLELSYQMIYPNPSGEPKLVLVYTEKNSNRPIDALTGEIINQTYYVPLYGVEEKAAASGAGDAGGYIPTPEEQKVIDESGKYISKEKAMEALKKYVTIDSKHKLNNSSLYGGYKNENAAWSFSWSYTDEDHNTYSYIYGTVDAVTGEVRSFSISGSEKEQKPGSTHKYTIEQCREIAEKFLKEIQPVKFNSSEYREQYYQPYSDLEKISVYNMNFIRKENGVPAPFNNLNVSVNAYTGKITGFYMNWSNPDFPDVKDVIRLEEAYKTLYAKHDLVLKYIRTYDYRKSSGNAEIKLAYVLDNLYGMIDAKSGQFIDYSGKPVRDAVKTGFTDIKGHKYENDIALLSELGIIDSAESKFNPDAKILQKDFIKLLMRAIQPEYYPIPYAADESSDDSYYERAILQNILTSKDKKPEAAVTKMEAAKMLVKSLDIGFVADLSSIFSLDVKDAADIASENKGYAAIAAALKLADTSTGSFNPSLELTRGETAAMLVNLLKVEKTPADSQVSDAPAIMPISR